MAYASGLFDDRDEPAGPPPPDGPSRRVTAVLVGAGLVLLLAAGAGFLALRSDGDRRPSRPPGARETVAPVVPVSTGSPTAASPETGPASGSPAASRAAPASATPAKPPASPTRGAPRVQSVTVSADPAAFTNCRGRLTADLTVRLTLSGPGAAVRYTINDVASVHRTATGTAFAETTRIAVPSNRGEYRVTVTVSEPSAASAQTTIELDCGR